MVDKHKILLSILVILMIIVCLIILLTQILTPTSDRKLINLFNKHEELLSLVVIKLEKTEYENINITKSEFEDNMYVQDDANYVGKIIKINDSILLKNIQKLFKSNFEIIRKDKDIIYFQVYSNRDIGKGIMYCHREKTPNKIEGIIELTPINDNWYIYEER